MNGIKTKPCHLQKVQGFCYIATGDNKQREQATNKACKRQIKGGRYD